MTPARKTPRVTCDHDLAERDTSIADGLCPLCLQTDLSAAIKERDEWKRKAEAMTLLAERNYPQLHNNGACSRHRDNGHYECTVCYPSWKSLCGEHVKVNGKVIEDRDAWRSLARRLAEAVKNHKSTDGNDKTRNAVAVALADFGQMEKGTSPTSAQPPSI